MSSREVHKLISKIITGYECDKTHATLDWPVKYLAGNHRILFHDPISAFVIGYFCNGPEGAVSAMAHIATDYVVIKCKKKI